MPHVFFTQQVKKSRIPLSKLNLNPETIFQSGANKTKRKAS